MAGNNGSILNYWSAVPQSKGAKASAPSGTAQAPQTTAPAAPAALAQQPPQPRAISPFSPPPKTGATTFPISPMPIHVARSPAQIRARAQAPALVSAPAPPPTTDSSTASRGSRMSPESIPSSPDSFPPSPIQTHVFAKSQKENLAPPPPLKLGAGFSSREIRDSDEDDFDSGSDASGDSAESLRDAVRFSEPFRSLTTSASSTSLPAAGTGRASTGGVAAVSRTAPSSSPNDSSSAPSVSKRRAAAAVLTPPMPVRRAKQARVGWQARNNVPKHKFDMKALLRHAEEESATERAVQRVADLEAEAERKAQREKEEGEKRMRKVSSAPLLDGIFDSAAGSAVGTPGGSVSGGDGGGGGDNGAFGSFNKERLRKALDRTEVAVVSESWYFFKEYFVPSPAKRRPFPQKAAATGSRWAFLRDATMRQDFFMTGVVRKALASAGGNSSVGIGSSSQSASQQTIKEPHLPDELFLWILSEACMDPLPALRTEYAAVLRCCPEQVRRFVDAERLLLLFQKLGPRWESIDLSTRLELVPTIHRPYPGRDWSPLRSLLSLVAALADCLSLETVSCAVKILLRLGIDRVVEETPDILQSYQEAVRKLVGRVPLADWNDFVSAVHHVQYHLLSITNTMLFSATMPDHPYTTASKSRPCGGRCWPVYLWTHRLVTICGVGWHLCSSSTTRSVPAWTHGASCS